ncbi:MAG: cell division protein FtsZ [Chloroflexi bacterium]|nr:cell division protein FtsZ [Chloroflexota bacterium]
MKLIVIGLGQCGGRIADEFARLNRRARGRRGIEIVLGAFAVNTDDADLTGLSYIDSDYQHRILIGRRKTSGHGVGKINELGAEIAREDGDKIVDAIRTVKKLFEADAFMVIAGCGGGTGSGSLPIISQYLKERYRDMPVYNIVVLPFLHEEETEERTIYNSATCIKSASAIADAIFLIDNQRYVKKDFSLRSNLAKINSMIAEPFYDVLCAGEEKKGQYVGAKTLDAGDIMATLSGWTVIGCGSEHLPTMVFPFEQTRHFRKKGAEISRGVETMDKAVGELSLQCDPKNAGRAMYLLSAPPKQMNMELIKELGDYLRELAPNATIRSGDYPREKGVLDVTVILSELKDVEKVRKYYEKTTAIIPKLKRREEDIESGLKDLDKAAKDIPSLL